jgi:hypothetical protein
MGISFLLFQMNWSMKRKSSRPSQTSSTRPLPRCPVTKKKPLPKKPFFKYRPKNPYPIFHYTVPTRPPNFFGKLGRISSPICPNNYSECSYSLSDKTNKQTLQHTYFVFFLNFFFVNKTSPETEIKTSCDVFVPSLYPCLF